MAFSLCTKCSRRNKSPASSHHRININYFQSFCFNKYSIFPWLWVVCCWVKIIVIFVSRSQLWCLSHKKYWVLIHVSWRGSFLYDLMLSETWNLQKDCRSRAREYWNWCKSVSLVSYLLLSENCRLHLFSLSAATILQPGARPALQAVLQSPAFSLQLLLPRIWFLVAWYSLHSLSSQLSPPAAQGKLNTRITVGHYC